MIFLLSFFISFSIMAEDCPSEFGRYGNSISYQNTFCRFFITADRTSSENSRNLTFTDDGLIQVFSNFPGTTNSNSTGARVYYLFPIREAKKILTIGDKGISIQHPSGAQFNFNEKGRVSSPDLEMTTSSEINSKNKSGIEIKNYKKGLVFDLGYRMGNTPVSKKETIVTVTDKNNKKCTLLNREINNIKGDEVSLIYKTNKELHQFLIKKCPSLDLSDFLEKNLFTNSTEGLGSPPKLNEKKEVDNTKRDVKPKIQDLEKLIESLQENKKSSMEK